MIQDRGHKVHNWKIYIETDLFCSVCKYYLPSNVARMKKDLLFKSRRMVTEQGMTHHMPIQFVTVIVSPLTCGVGGNVVCALE